MEWLSEILFRDSPKRVRQRKMQMLIFAVVLGLIACVLVGVVIYFMGKQNFR